ncbi:hypothetical protein B0181_00935 [Moraxella caviae]|uniref:Uncharacterized protein n=1 Tax=Moraxella caviae TaxID=34060 RepID=A0A1T0ABH2_9GAMM|nr:hypothetical protein B0181_00935 [Moraxella caviae]
MPLLSKLPYCSTFLAQHQFADFWLGGLLNWQAAKLTSNVIKNQQTARQNSQAQTHRLKR